MADYTVTAASVVPSSSATFNRSFNAGTTITAGQPVYLDASNTWQLSDANAAAPANDVLGLSAHGASAGQPLAVITDDPALTHGIGSIAAGVPVFVSGTAGKLCPASDVVTGIYPLLVLVTKSATVGVLRLIKTGAAV